MGKNAELEQAALQPDTSTVEKQVRASTAKKLSCAEEQDTVLVRPFGESYLMRSDSLRSRRNDYSPTRPASEV